MIFPWQTPQWKALLHAKSEHRLPQALLFAGVAGIGKTQFAEYFVRALVCDCNPAMEHQDKDQANQNCNGCRSCRLITDRVHPNVLWIEPEKEGQAIKIDQIRVLSEFIQHSSLQGNRRVAIIHPAHTMNLYAANALLKTLEEPSSGSIIILISNQAGSLPKTVLSRCQYVRFLRPKTEEGLHWLKTQLPHHPVSHIELLLRLAQGAPLAALTLAEDTFFVRRKMCLQSLYLLSQKQADPSKLAAELEDLETAYLLNLILTWTIDLIWLQLEVEPHQIVNQDFLNELCRLKQCTSVIKMTQFIIYLQQLCKHLLSNIHLNKLLMIEDILIRWMRLTA